MANKMYELIDKYYLKKYPYCVIFLVNDENQKVSLEYNKINSAQDIIDNYLN